MRIVFMGTPEFSVPILKGLIENYNVIGVVTQPDKKVGRKQELKYPPIKDLALEHNIRVIQPVNIKKEYQEILDLNPDIIITCAYGQIIPKEILDYPEYGCINVHASLLPKLRGGAPIHRAIQLGYKKTGITIMYMDEKMDEGDIISNRSIEILDSDSVGTLHDRLSLVGKDLLLETLPTIFDKTNKRIKQNNDEATYAYNIKREEEQLDFSKSSREIFDHIRAFNPWPGTYFKLNDKVYKVWDAYIVDDNYNGDVGEIVKLTEDNIIIKTKDSNIAITAIQPEGKTKMAVKDYLNGKGKEEIIVGSIINM